MESCGCVANLHLFVEIFCKVVVLSDKMAICCCKTCASGVLVAKWGGVGGKIGVFLAKEKGLDFSKPFCVKLLMQKLFLASNGHICATAFGIALLNF